MTPIKDDARQAGVSPATVSSALAGSAGVRAEVREAIHEQGIRIPDDMALVMFEDPRWARLAASSLSAVALLVRRLAESAVGLLLDRQPEPRAQSRVLVFSPELRVRASSPAALIEERIAG